MIRPRSRPANAQLILSDTESGSSVAPREQYPSSRSALLTCTDRANCAFRFRCRSSPVPDALDILSQLSARGVRFALGGSVYDWNDPFARMFLQILAVIAEFEAKPHPPAHPRGHGHRPPERRAPRQAARPQGRPGPRDPPHARQRRLQHRRDRRPVQRQQANRVPVPGAHHQPAPAPRGTRPAPDVAKYGQLLTRRPN
jgi:Resolvase, N terminal domain